MGEGLAGFVLKSPCQTFLWFTGAEKAAAEGEYARSQEFFLKLLEVARQVKDRGREAHYLMRLGDISWNLGQMATSKSYYEASLRAAEENGQEEMIQRNRALLDIHRLYAEGKALRDEKRMYSRSVELFLKAMHISKLICSQDHEYKCLRQLSLNYNEMQDYEYFLDLNLQVKNYAIRCRNHRELSMSNTNIGLYHLKKYDFSRALIYLTESLVFAEKEDEKQLISENCTNIGIIYFELGDYNRASEYFQKAIRIDLELGNKYFLALDLNNLGNIKKRKNYFGECLTIYLDALMIAWESNDEYLESIILNNFGDAYYLLGKYDESLNRFIQAYRCAKKSCNREMESLALDNIGNIFLIRKEYVTALSYYIRSLEIAEKMNNPNILWDVYFGMGKCFEGIEKHEDAIKYYDKAIEVFGEVRNTINIDPFKLGYDRNKFKTFESIIELLISLEESEINKFNERLYYYIEKAKSRVFLENMTQSKRDVFDKNIQDQRIKLDEITQRLSKLQIQSISEQLSMEKRKEIEKITMLEESSYLNLSDKYNFIERKSVYITYPKILNSLEIQNELLTEDTAIVEYYLGVKSSLIIIITKRELVVHKLPEKSVIEDSIRAYIKFLSNRIERKNIEEYAGMRIFNELCFPFRKLRKMNIRKLIIIPDGLLNLLAFETLIDIIGGRKKKILDIFDISYAPSSSVLFQIKKISKELLNEKGILAFGNPDINEMKLYEGVQYDIEKIPFSKKEVKEVACYFKRNERNIYLNKQANEVVIKEIIKKKYQIIHFACHGLLDGDIPLRSALILARGSEKEDGFLQVRELYDLNIRANLIILSACQSGRGYLERGEGIYGLPRVFLYTGSRSVISSLWQIDDKATALFMKKFYSLLENGHSKAKALRETKKEMQRTKYRHPYYWAGFVLNGDGESKITFH